MNRALQSRLSFATPTIATILTAAFLTNWTSPAAAQPVPSVTLSAPAAVRIGENFSFTATFDNTSAIDAGFGPFINLIFPVNGADGAAGTDSPDGIDFVSATYLGISIASTVLTFPLPGPTSCVAHPLAVDTLGLPLQVCGIPGDKLVVLYSPFGSVTNDQPHVAIMVNATTSTIADLGVALPLRARGVSNLAPTR